MPLLNVHPGVWIAPETVQSVVAFGEERYSNKVLAGPRVDLRAGQTAASYGFDTFDKAREFADQIAATVNSALGAPAPAKVWTDEAVEVLADDVFDRIQFRSGSTTSLRDQIAALLKERLR